MNLNLSRVIGHSTVITEHHAKEVCNETDFIDQVTNYLKVQCQALWLVRFSSGLNSPG